MIRFSNEVYEDSYNEKATRKRFWINVCVGTVHESEGGQLQQAPYNLNRCFGYGSPWIRVNLFS
jgi:hypothetical protein